MPTRQVKDIIDHIRACHARMNKKYADLSTQKSDERIGLLLNYMARHEQNFEACLADYEHDAAKGILDTWIPFVPEETLDEAFEQFELRDDMTPEEVISCALALDRRLNNLYRQLADETSVPRGSMNCLRICWRWKKARTTNTPAAFWSCRTNNSQPSKNDVRPRRKDVVVYIAVCRSGRSRAIVQR